MTICPYLKFRSKFVNVVDVIRYLQGSVPLRSIKTNYYNVNHIVNTLPLVCKLSDLTLNSTIIPTLATKVDFDVMNLLKSARAEFNRTFVKCTVKESEQMACATCFKEVFTEDGLCYTFNGLLPNHMYRNNTCVFLQL